MDDLPYYILIINDFSSGVSQKWVKDNERRQKREERVKVRDYNAQYICMNQKDYFPLVIVDNTLGEI